MLKFLIKIKVIQQKPKDGYLKYKLERLNPYNPLAYIILFLAFIAVLVLYGIMGVPKYMDGNPFKWR